MSLLIDHVVLTHVRVPLVEPFRISSGVIAEKDAIVVRLSSGGVSGYGESSPMSGPFYSSDTPESCWCDLREQIVPRFLQQSFESHEQVIEYANSMPGSRFAKTGLETALWDLEAKWQRKPLYELLGGRNVPVESGLAVGLYDDPADMLRVIERYLRDGYKRVKIKIERGRDVELVRAVRRAFGDIPLFVDANGAYDLSDSDVFRQLDEFKLLMFEQPFAGSMLAEMAELQRQVQTPICLDESLESNADLEKALALGSFRIANIKIQRVGGLSRALSMIALCRNNDIPIWMGTMPELGIGGAQAVALATLGCAFPTDVEASSRWFRDEIVEPQIEVKDGMIRILAGSGLGYAVDEAKLRQYSVATETFAR